MNHTAVADMFQTYTPSIDFLARNFPAVEYTLSEVGNSLAGKGNPGNLSFQAGLGAALWSVDMQLYAMSKVGLARLTVSKADIESGCNAINRLLSDWSRNTSSKWLTMSGRVSNVYT